MLILVFFFLILAIVLLWAADSKRRAVGLPPGRVIYSDTSRWMPAEASLYDPDQQLAGKPDYLIQDGDMVIPVEVKSGHVFTTPYDSHIYQLAAYCWLVERTYGQRPSYGIIHYQGSESEDQTFAVPYTTELESSLLHLLSEMRNTDDKSEVSRSHQMRSRCEGCGYRMSCDQSLE